MNNTIHVTLPSGKRVDADYKGFHFETDQPLHDGGDNSAPAPFDFFMVSLATCAGYYAMAFCEGRQIPYDDITLNMEIEYDREKRRIGKIKIQALLPPGFPEKYRLAIIRSMESCTVKKYMENAPAFETTAIISARE